MATRARIEAIDPHIVLPRVPHDLRPPRAYEEVCVHDTNGTRASHDLLLGEVGGVHGVCGSAALAVGGVCMLAVRFE